MNNPLVEFGVRINLVYFIKRKCMKKILSLLVVLAMSTAAFAAVPVAPKAKKPAVHKTVKHAVHKAHPSTKVVKTAK